MSILAMYEAAQWHCPARVLTHRDDITAVLAERRIPLLQVKDLPSDQAQQQRLALELIAAQGFPLPAHLRAAQQQGEPGYADGPVQLPFDAVKGSAGQWLLFCVGQARVCLGQVDAAVVLATRPGDLLWIPAGYDWALIPAPGSLCHWLAMAATEQALNDAPAAESKLGELQLLDI